MNLVNLKSVLKAHDGNLELYSKDLRLEVLHLEFYFVIYIAVVRTTFVQFLSVNIHLHRLS